MQPRLLLIRPRGGRNGCMMRTCRRANGHKLIETVESKVLSIYAAVLDGDGGGGGGAEVRLADECSRQVHLCEHRSAGSNSPSQMSTRISQSQNSR